MKKRTILLILVLVLLAAGAAAVCVGLVRAGQAQELVYADYAAAVRTVEDARLSVTENGAPVATYTLADLSLRDDALAAAGRPYSALDRMEPEAFRRCSIQTRLSYLRAERPEPGEVALDLAHFDAAPVLADLHAKRRQPSTDAQIAFADGAWAVVPETQGTELDDAAVTEALRALLDGRVLSADDAVIGWAVTPDCYRKPEVTAETLEFDPEALLAGAISGQSLNVAIFDEHRGLSETAIAGLLSVSPEGKLSADQAGLAAIVEKWALDCDRHYVDYVFSAYSGDQVSLPFIKVDYAVDQPALTAALAAALEGLDFSGLEAPVNCFRNGEAFDISGTYVEVDIDHQTMSMCKDGKFIVHTSVVTGALDGHQTPTGFYHVENKDTDAWLSGPDYLVFVKYWVGIYGPYGLHDSSWRENYGSDYYVNGGSHGCVNTPESAMKTIFDNIEVGDPVVVFGKNQWYDTSKQ